MAVVIRLRRTGRKNLPCYRINVADSRFPRDGRMIETIGLYDPLRKDAATQVQIDAERAKYWMSQGARVSDVVASIFRRSGIPVVHSTTVRERVRTKKTATRARRDALKKSRTEAKSARASARKKAKRAAAKAGGEKAEAKS